jgi:anti-sigma B factor antagonist
MTVLATITDDRRGGVAIARIEGEIDASNVTWAEARLRSLVTNHCEALVVDLTAITYLDSAGIALLFELAADLGRHQQELRLVVADGSSIARVLQLTAIAGAAPTHPTLDAALGQQAGA